jgi:hypothetical protein
MNNESEVRSLVKHPLSPTQPFRTANVFQTIVNHSDSPSAEIEAARRNMNQTVRNVSTTKRFHLLASKSAS